MKRSVERILTTHIGSLPRPDDLLGMLQAKEAGKTVDAGAFAQRVRKAVAESVARQRAIGLDIVNDGEQGKPSFVTYVNERLEGIEPKGTRGNPWRGSREAIAFPEFYAPWEQAARGPGAGVQMMCTGPLKYKGLGLLRSELADLRAALDGAGASEAFVPSISTTNVEAWLKNAYYRSAEEYLSAIADAMHEEYRAIVEAGFLLQVDDPRLVTYYMLNADASVEQCRAWAGLRVEALNRALRGIPAERVRYHTCYSINMGPRVHDMELKDIVDVILRIDAGAYSFEAANPRHEHEWRVWEDIKLPDGKLLIPGVISHTTYLVEHPELVAERIARFARVVGRENVIAGADCGFATFASSKEMHPSIVWAKLDALVKGARLASRALWR